MTGKSYVHAELKSMTNQQLAHEINFLPFYDEELIDELFIRAYGCYVAISPDSPEYEEYIQEAADKLNLKLN